MFIYEFPYVTKENTQVTAVIAQDDEVYAVNIDDEHYGSMVEDDSAPSGFKADEPILEEILDDFIMAWKEALAIDNLPEALKELYPNDIVTTLWTTDKDLRIVAASDTDLTEFASAIREQINEIILFDKPLVIYLSNEAESENHEIFVN